MPARRSNAAETKASAFKAKSVTSRAGDPDQTAIAALKQRLEVLKAQLTEDELSLDTLEQVITENC